MTQRQRANRPGDGARVDLFLLLVEREKDRLFDRFGGLDMRLKVWRQWALAVRGLGIGCSPLRRAGRVEQVGLVVTWLQASASSGAGWRRLIMGQCALCSALMGMYLR